MCMWQGVSRTQYVAEHHRGIEAVRYLGQKGFVVGSISLPLSEHGSVLRDVITLQLHLAMITEVMLSDHSFGTLTEFCDY